jgi:hypothetical protein
MEEEGFGKQVTNGGGGQLGINDCRDIQEELSEDSEVEREVDKIYSPPLTPPTPAEINLSREELEALPERARRIVVELMMKNNSLCSGLMISSDSQIERTEESGGARSLDDVEEW